MKINKQSGLYTVIYITVIVIVVGAALAYTSLSLKPRQQANISADKMSQILASAHIPAGSDVAATFKKSIVAQNVYNAAGEVIGDDAFNVDVAAQAKLPEAERSLPLFICSTDKGTKYIIPLYGAGLWGPIWGYVSFDADGSTIYGAYFSHQGETPGLGAEIAKPEFTSRFAGKHVWKNGRFIPVTVVKKGMKPSDPDADYVDGISGGTITSKGVASMLDNCLKPYQQILKKLSESNGTETK